MKHKILGVTVLAAALLLVAATSALAAYPSPDEPVLLTEPAVAKLPPVAIGAHRLAGTHLVPPARGVVLAKLREQGLPLDASPEEVEAALKDYYARFSKQSQTWVNPKFQEWVLEREARLAADTVAPMAIQPVTATVFAMAVDFGATETFTIPVEQPDGSCMTETTTIEGPLAGEMPPPGVGDNFTLWYSPSLTTDPKFYEKIIFGYEGAGRARFDLTDPDDGLPGINLAGLTVQDYFDNVAGDGNVYITGTVEGWVTVPHSEGYYGADNCQTGASSGGAGHTPADLVADALAVFMADHPTYYDDTSPDAFWPQFDGNNDGVLDTFWVIHAGMGQEGGGGEQGTFALWSHSSDVRFYADYPDGIKVYEGDAGTTDDDIIVGPYTVQPENAETGVFAEEFGHNFFGLPDLYTTDASNSIGDWNIMSGGAWMGWLGGTQPASMPLWFKMIAAFDTDGIITPVNWHEPMVTRDYTDPAADVTIGQLEKTPAGVNKGVRVDLPSYTLSVDNMAGTGVGAYSGTGRDQTDAIMSQEIEVGAAATGILTLDAYWDIEDDWDYGYVMVDGMPIPDMDGVTTNYDPNGNNLGNGLTSYGSGELRFDLSAYAGQTIELALRYKTDAAVTYPGWWVDNIALDGTLIDDFEGATAPGTFPGWTNSDPGWLVVPTTATHQRYYLVEWRAMTKYDQMIHKSAYIHTYINDDELVDTVSRIPYNMPAALLYYRDTRYGSTYAMHPNASHPPSDGSKYQLLIVDQNWEPTRIFSGTVGSPDAYEGYWTGRISSYDSGLTLQDTDVFTIPTYYGIPGLPPQVYPSKSAVTKFNDALGYYGGYYYGAPCPAGYVCWNERDGSAVVPARDLYSTRIVDFSGNPIYGFYGYGWAPSWFGDGKPGTDNVQFGVNIELKDMVHTDPYASTATLSFYNYSVDIESSVDKTSISGVKGETYSLVYQIVVENTGTETAEDISVTPAPLAGDLIPVDVDITKGSVNPLTGSWTISTLVSGEVATATVTVQGTVSEPETVSVMITANDGQIDRGPWFFDTDIETYSVYLPIVQKASNAPNLTILHTNDFHGNLESDYRGRGGSAYMAGVVESVRAAEGEDNVLLVDAGDAFFGAPPISQLMMGESAIDIYNMLEYDIATLGNHEFDKGQEVLEDRVEQSDFPWIGANVVVSGTAWEHPDWVEPYVVLEAGGFDIGFIGLDTDETPLVTLKGTTEGLEFKDMTEAVLHYYDEVMAQSDALIVLVHMGTEDSGEFKGLETVAQELAAADKSVDLMIGGHQHEYLDEPVYVGDTAIIVAYQYGRVLGRADVAVDPATKSLEVVNYEYITINNELTPDPEVEARVAYWADQVAPLVNQVVGYTNVDLVRDYNAESNMGNLVADGMLWKADEYDDGEVNGSVDIAFTNPGGLRADIEIPDGATTPYTVTWGDTFNVMPFGNTLFLMDLTGEQIQTLVDQSASLYKGIMQTAGATWYWYNDCQCDTPTSWGAYNVMVGGEPLDPAETYRVVTNNFLAGGQDGWVTFAEGTNRWDSYFDMQEGVNEYIAWYADEVGPIDYAVEGRIVYTEEP